MKSIKPGRGPSMMGGFMSIAMAAFGVLWTLFTASIAGGFFALFGVVFIIIAIVQAVYNFKNATSKNRYSEFDITDGNEEPDPFNERFGTNIRYQGENKSEENENGECVFCPYCGTKVENDFEFCNKCGKKLP